MSPLFKSTTGQGRPSAVWAIGGVLLLTGLALWGGDGLWRVEVESENLRAAPNGKKIGTLLEGTSVDTLETDGRWVRVRLEGWVWGPSLDGFVEAPKEEAPTSKKAADEPPLLRLTPKIKRMVNADYGTFYSLDWDQDFKRLRLRLRVEDIGAEALALRQQALHRLLLDEVGTAVEYDQVEVASNRPDGSGQVGAEVARIERAALVGLEADDQAAWQEAVRLSSDGGETWNP